MTLLDVHHGLMAASQVVHAVTGIAARLFLVWLAWQILFRSGLEWRWFKAPMHMGSPVRQFRITLCIPPQAGKYRRLPVLPCRDPYDWAVTWLWFRVRWAW